MGVQRARSASCGIDAAAHWPNVNGVVVDRYAKYSLQNYLNIADLSPNLGGLAADFLQLWSAPCRRAAHTHAHTPTHADTARVPLPRSTCGAVRVALRHAAPRRAASRAGRGASRSVPTCPRARAPLARDHDAIGWEFARRFADAAQSFLPGAGIRGGAHNRAYRTAAFFAPDADGVRGPTWLFGWWRSADVDVVEYAVKWPQLTLFATSLWRPLPVVTALATADGEALASSFTYETRRMGDSLPCQQQVGT